MWAFLVKWQFFLLKQEQTKISWGNSLSPKKCFVPIYLTPLRIILIVWNIDIYLTSKRHNIKVKHYVGNFISFYPPSDPKVLYKMSLFNFIPPSRQMKSFTFITNSNNPFQMEARQIPEPSTLPLINPFLYCLQALIAHPINKQGQKTTAPNKSKEIGA